MTSSSVAIRVLFVVQMATRTFLLVSADLPTDPVSVFRGVDLGRHQPQVIWVDTHMVATNVIKQHPVRDQSNQKFPSEAMSLGSGSLAVTNNEELSVPLTVESGSPFPADADGIYLGPEPFFFGLQVPAGHT